MKRLFAGAMLAFLVGCTEPEPVVTTLEGYRDTSALIASQTDVSAGRMAGSWYIRQRFANQPGPTSFMELAALPGGALQWSFEGGDCVDDVCFSTETLVMLEPAGPGRWLPVGDNLGGFDVELWVLWMDFDTRTMAIGTPDGRFGFIMDKAASGGGDRIIAARDIMTWQGYDVARLEEVRR